MNHTKIWRYVGYVLMVLMAVTAIISAYLGSYLDAAINFCLTVIVGWMLKGDYSARMFMLSIRHHPFPIQIAKLQEWTSKNL